MPLPEHFREFPLLQNKQALALALLLICFGTSICSLTGTAAALSLIRTTELDQAPTSANSDIVSLTNPTVGYSVYTFNHPKKSTLLVSVRNVGSISCQAEWTAMPEFFCR